MLTKCATNGPSTENIIQCENDETMIRNHFSETTEISVENPYKKHRKLKEVSVKLSVFSLIWCYFAWASYHFYNSNLNFSHTTCSGYGFLTILMVFINFAIFYKLILKSFILPKFRTYFWLPIVNLLGKIKYGSVVFYVMAICGILGFLVYDTTNDRKRLMPLTGLFLYLVFGYLYSTNRSKIPWNTVIWGFLLQFTFGLLTIRWSIGREIFDCIGNKVNVFLNNAINGSAFVYGNLLIYKEGIFAFKALSAIFFLGFIINILYYYNIMQKIVLIFGKFLQWIMGTSICESVNCAANIFLGMSEAPLLLKPYLHQLTDSEITSVMTSGFASVSGTVLAAYLSFGANPAHLITSCVMSAPAALCYSKLLHPETEDIATTENLKKTTIKFQSVLDAASKGAQDAVNIVLAIIANLISFLAFIYFINGILSWLGILVGFQDENQWSIDFFIGKLFIPISYVMGVPWEECEKIGQLIGIKTMVNEFVAFQKMSSMTLSAKSKVIATYSICGFSNPGSVGITVSALTTLIPTKRDVITKYVFRAFIGGSIACFMTACIAALLIPDDVV